MKLPSGVTRLAGRQLLKLQKNSPNIMFAAGIVGGVTATVLACKATLRLEEVVTPHEADRAAADATLNDPTTAYTQDDHDHDVRVVRVRIARDVTKLYAPSVAVGAVSIALLAGAHITLTRRNASLAAAYGLLDKAFREYRARVKDELGEDKDREFMFGAKDVEVVTDGEHTHEVKTEKRASGAHSPYARVFDENNRRWSRNDILATRSFLQAQQNYLNDLLQARGHVFLNDAYDVLGMERSKAGAVVGWVKNNKSGDNFIDFGLFYSADPVMRDFMMLEDTKGIVIDFNVDGVVYELLDREF